MDVVLEVKDILEYIDAEWYREYFSYSLQGKEIKGNKNLQAWT